MTRSRTPQARVRAAAIAAAGAAVAVAGGAWAAGGGASAAGPPLYDAASVSCTTDRTGYCIVQHKLQQTPGAVLATLGGAGNGRNAAAVVMTDQYTATTFRVRIITASGSPDSRATVPFA